MVGEFLLPIGCLQLIISVLGTCNISQASATNGVNVIATTVYHQSVGK